MENLNPAPLQASTETKNKHFNSILGEVPFMLGSFVISAFGYGFLGFYPAAKINSTLWKLLYLGTMALLCSMFYWCYFYCMFIHPGRVPVFFVGINMNLGLSSTG